MEMGEGGREGRGETREVGCIGEGRQGRKGGGREVRMETWGRREGRIERKEGDGRRGEGSREALGERGSGKRGS